MSKSKENRRPGDIISIAQIVSVSLIWVLVVSVTVWLLYLLQLAMELKDAPGFSVGISLVAIPVFWTLAGVLTYVFVGLRRNQRIDSL